MAVADGDFDGDFGFLIGFDLQGLGLGLADDLAGLGFANDKLNGRSGFGAGVSQPGVDGDGLLVDVGDGLDIPDVGRAGEDQFDGIEEARGVRTFS
jgi:hypothetical protein